MFRHFEAFINCPFVTTDKANTKFTRYLNDIGSGLTMVLAEMNVDSSEKAYYSRGFELISQERNGGFSVYLHDGHGNVRALTGFLGNLTDSYFYDAWGNLLNSTGDTVNSFLYCGEQFDETTGLYYLRARYMNPTTGTFVTMDTYQGSIFDPASLHKYLYCRANPVMRIDPSGYNGLSDTIAAQNGGINMEAASAYAASFALSFLKCFLAGAAVALVIAQSILSAVMQAQLDAGLLDGTLDSADVNEAVKETIISNSRKNNGSGWIHYEPLDELGRATGAIAQITRDMLDKGSGASQSIKPPGFLGGSAGHSRGHLIGKQLGGSGTDRRNLVTLYQNPTNTGDMSKREAEIKNAVQSGETVFLVVRALYNYDELMPYSILMVAIGDRGFYMSVNIYNTKPGGVFDYDGLF